MHVFNYFICMHAISCITQYHDNSKINMNFLMISFNYSFMIKIIEIIKFTC